MNPINKLKKEHCEIERELFELESIMEDEIINYSNLVHTFKKLCEIWDKHEREEERLFMAMEREQIKVPVYIMTCEHKDIAGYVKDFKDAVNSGSDFKVRECFDKDLRILVNKIREHMDREDEILYMVALSLFSESELIKMVKAVKRNSNLVTNIIKSNIC